MNGHSKDWSPMGPGRGWMVGAVCLVFCVAAREAESAEDRVPSKLPNIVMIISDDQSWTDYGFMGHPTIQTPHLDQLASESVTFRRGYVPTALCRPSLVTMVTGLYPHQHGVTGNDPARGDGVTADDYAALRAALIANIDQHPTLPQLLGRAGYLSHQSGKWWEGNYRRGGFTHGMTRGFPQPGGRHGDDGLKIGRNGMQPIEDFLDHVQSEEKPFFMWYAPFLPHTPHTPPKRILDKYRQPGRPETLAKYYAMVDWFDETCGQLLSSLDRRGLSENTLVVYVVDNGWIQQTPALAKENGWRAGGYAPRSKQSAYEGGVRNPILFRWPGKLQPADRPDLVSSIDLMPTILAAAGVDIPDGLPGLNLLPQLESGESITRDHLYGESFAHDVADVHDPQKSLLYRWVVQGDWKLLLSYDGEIGRYQWSHSLYESGPQLFRITEDPHETTNVAADHPEKVKELTALIDEVWAVETPLRTAAR